MNASLANADDFHDEEIAASVLRLHETQQRLQELAGGEVDAVLLPGGQSFLLHAAQEKLRQGEAIQRGMAEMQIAILNALPAHIALLDAQGVILSVNDAWRRFATANVLQGPEFGVGQNYLEVCTRAQGDCSEEAEDAARGIRRVLRGEAKEFTLEYPCHSPADKRWFRLMVTPLQEGQLSGVVVMHVNVSERKLAEEALRESEERFRGTFEQAAVGIAHFSTEGRFLRVNDKLCAIFGYDREELLELTSADLTVPEDRAACEEARLAMVAGKLASYDTEKRYLRKSGEVVWTHLVINLQRAAVGEPRYFISVFDDITARKQVEEALQNSERQQRELAAQLEAERARLVAAQAVAKVGSWEMDFATSTLTWSEETYRIFGTTPERFPHTHAGFLELVHPEDREAVDDALIQSLSGRGPFAIEHRLLSPDGRVTFVEERWDVLSDARGGSKRAIGTCQDITERKLVEERRRGQEEAERANRAKSEFLSRMSHELRTPLHAILGFAQLLEVDDRNDEDKESVAQIMRAGGHLLGLINEVLDIARVESGKLALTPEPVSVRETLEETLSLVKVQAADCGVRIEPLRGDLDCQVLANAQRFKQVVLNLLSNAVKFNQQGGSVTVACQKIADYLRIAVADTGRGIPAESMGKLFAPFERLDVGDAAIEGTGLGLSLSKHLVEAMGGRIGVESELGKGSTFWIELPLNQGTRATTPTGLIPDAPIPSVAEAPRSTVPRTLLYIEDNLSNLRLVERILARRPEVTLLSALQGRLGLDLARGHLPDLILLDLQLPDLRGDEVLRQLRADPATADIPVVMISADATTGQIERLRAAGANEYLTKPINIRSFLAIVDAALPRTAAPPS